MARDELIQELADLLESERQIDEARARQDAIAEATNNGLIPFYADPASKSLLKTIVPTGSSMLGSGLGAALGIAAAPATGGASIPLTLGLGFTGGYLGDILGTTAGKAAVGKPIDLKQIEKEAELGALIGAGLGPVAKGVGYLARGGKKYLYDPAVRAYKELIGPQTPEAARELVGETLSNIQANVPKGQGIGAAKTMIEAAPAGSPRSLLTTAEATGDLELQKMQKLMSRQTGGPNEVFATRAAQQIDAFDKQASTIGNVGDNPKTWGLDLQSKIASAKEAMRKEASKAFDLEEVRNTPVSVGNLKNEIDNLYYKYFKDTEVNAPKGELNTLYQKALELTQAAPAKQPKFGTEEYVAQLKAKKAGKAVAKAPAAETTVGMIQDLRSALLEQYRNLPDGSPDAVFAAQLGDKLDKVIDNVQGIKQLQDARYSWRKYKTTFFYDDKGKTPLATLLDTRSGEKVLQKAQSESAYTDAIVKLAKGFDKNLASGYLSEFTALPDAASKLAWIKSKDTIGKLQGTALWPIIKDWEKDLTKIVGSGIPEQIKNLTADNISVQSKAVIRALGGGGNIALSAGERAVESQGRNLTRSLATQQLRQVAGQGLLGAGIGGYAGGYVSGENFNPAGAVAGAGLGLLGRAGASSLATGAASKAFSSKIAQGTNLTSQALTEALSNPAAAMEMLQAYRQAPRALVREIPVPQLQQIAPYGAAAGALLSPVFSGGATPTATPAPAPQTEPMVAEQEIVPTPMPTPVPGPMAEEPMQEDIDTGNLGDYGEGELMGDTIETLDGTPVSIPMGEGYAEPNLVKAIIAVESGGRAGAVSNKGAVGMMQLMPPTAKALGVDPKDPQQNIEGGSRYINQQLQKFGTVELALAAYNMGPGALSRAIARADTDNWSEMVSKLGVYSQKNRKGLPKETINYVNKVLNFYSNMG